MSAKVPLELIATIVSQSTADKPSEIFVSRFDKCNEVGASIASQGSSHIDSTERKCHRRHICTTNF